MLGRSSSLLGIGMALTMPARPHGDGRRRPARAGIASGVVNARRQVGGALGIAIMGSVGATLTPSRFHEHVAGLPPRPAPTGSSRWWSAAGPR